MSTTPPTLPEAPDGFACPYRRQCWQREFIRIGATILIAAATAWLAKGCTYQVKAPGFEVRGHATWPTTQNTDAIRAIKGD